MMPDGSSTALKLDAAEPVSLEAAIALIEAGQAGAMQIALDSARRIQVTGRQEAERLLPRLRGHRRLLAMAAGSEDLSAYRMTDKPLSIAPEVREILDAAARPS
jgi:hypothetical protein